MRDLEPFAAWLKRRRKALDLTRTALAQRADCSASAVWRLETGDLRPSKSLAESLAAALGIPAEEREEFVRFARGESNQLAVISEQLIVNRTTVPTNLPAPLTSFVGRKREVTAVCELLRQEGVRLLTLTGPPGVGKTRLSLAVANRLADTAVFPDGAFSVLLAPIQQPELVVSAVAQALGVREPTQKENTLHDAVKHFLRPKQLLLVLDNFEQVTAAAPFVTDWLTAAPALKVLVTSREILHTYGEHEFPVPPLDIPDISRLPSPQARSFYTHYTAIQLFKERAQATDHNFRLTPDNLADVARICAWLDGLPLAIEMAAAQVKWLSTDKLYEQLSHRLATLTDGPRDLSPRQQSLHGAIEWSYHLLSAEQQELLNLLGAFVDGYDLEAIVEIGEWRSKDPQALISNLHSLIEKNLLRYNRLPTGETRYSMLETLREYARERLTAVGKLEATRQAHAEHYLRLAQTAEMHLVKGGDEAIWLNRLEEDHHNLRAALTWATEMPDRASFALQLAEAISNFWDTRGYFSEGRQWLETVLAMDNTPTELRGRVLNRVGRLARLQGDYAKAQTFQEQALAIQQQLGDEPGICRSLENLAILAGSQGNYALAGELLEQSITIWRRLGDLTAMVPALNDLAIVMQRTANFSRAVELYQDCIELCRATGNQKSLSRALYGLAQVRMELDDYATGLTLYQESLVIRQALGNPPGIYFALGGIGMALYHLGDAIGAAQLVSASVRLQEELGVGTSPANRAQVESNIALVRTQAGEEAFARAWAAGWAMSVEEAVAVALNQPVAIQLHDPVQPS